MGNPGKHRKRLRRYEIHTHVRFLTFSCFQKMPLFGNAAIKDNFAEQIELVRQRGAYRLHGWVIMPEHVHLLLTPNLPEWTISQVLSAIKRPFSRRVILRWIELDAAILPHLVDNQGARRFWQRGGGYDRNIHSDSEYFEKLDYIHANPVQRSLVNSVNDWMWSSARWYAGIRDEGVKIEAVEG